MTTHEPIDGGQQQRRGARLFFLGVALTLAALIALIVWQMNRVRSHVLATLGTPGAADQWQAWREDAAKPGPVARRKPKSTEPPALVLLRDYYAVCLVAAVFFSSLLFLLIVFLARGALSRRGKSGISEVEQWSSEDKKWKSD